MQIASYLRRIVLSYVACLTVHYFFRIFSQTTRFSGKKVTEGQKFVLIFSTSLFETFLILRMKRDIIIQYVEYKHIFF